MPGNARTLHECTEPLDPEVDPLFDPLFPGTATPHCTKTTHVCGGVKDGKLHERRWPTPSAAYRCFLSHLKPYECDFCGKRFGQRFHLTNHRRSVHKADGGKENNICKCGYKAADPSGMTRHIKARSQKEPDEHDWVRYSGMKDRPLHRPKSKSAKSSEGGSTGRVEKKKPQKKNLRKRQSTTAAPSGQSSLDVNAAAAAADPPIDPQWAGNENGEGPSNWVPWYTPAQPATEPEPEPAPEPSYFNEAFAAGEYPAPLTPAMEPVQDMFGQYAPNPYEAFDAAPPAPPMEPVEDIIGHVIGGHRRVPPANVVAVLAAQNFLVGNFEYGYHEDTTLRGSDDMFSSFLPAVPEQMAPNPPAEQSYSEMVAIEQYPGLFGEQGAQMGRLEDFDADDAELDPILQKCLDGTE